MNCYGTQGGCIKLPMQRALHHYTHYINTTIGFSTEVDQNLLDIAFLSNDTFFSSWIKYISRMSLCMISLIGYVNLSDTNN